jgi:hypothetical protein
MNPQPSSGIQALAWSLVALTAFSLSVGWMYWGRDAQRTETVVMPLRLWTCLQHLEIRESEPGKCRICGRPLVRASLLNMPTATGEPPQSDR